MSWLDILTVFAQRCQKYIYKLYAQYCVQWQAIAKENANNSCVHLAKLDRKSLKDQGKTAVPLQ